MVASGFAYSAFAYARCGNHLHDRRRERVCRPVLPERENSFVVIALWFDGADYIYPPFRLPVDLFQAQRRIPSPAWFLGNQLIRFIDYCFIRHLSARPGLDTWAIHGFTGLRSQHLALPQGELLIVRLVTGVPDKRCLFSRNVRFQAMSL